MKILNIHGLLLKGAILAFAVLTFHSAAFGGPGLVSDGGKTEVVAIESEPGLRAFVEAFIAANNTKDSVKMEALFHPKDFAALKAFVANQAPAPGQAKPTPESLLFQSAVPANHSPVNVQRYLKDSPLPSEGWVDWPVHPTHLLQFSFEPSLNNTVVILLRVTHVDNRWYAVHGVPNVEAIKKMTQSRTK